MFKRCVLVLVCVLFATSAFAQRDAIDLNTVVYHASLNVASWPVTKTITQVDLKPGTRFQSDVGVRLTLNPYNPAMHADQWPDFIMWPPAGDLRWTLWLFVKMNGVWHGAAVHEMWKDRPWTGAPLLTQYGDWIYPNPGSPWGEMGNYVPQEGDEVAFMASAGDLRLRKDRFTVNQRSNVVKVRLTSTATYTNFTSPHDLLVDLGAGGLWTLLDAANYSQINAANAKSVATGDIDGNGIDEVAVDFGAAQGIWVRWNSANWTQIHSLTANSIAMGDVDRNGRADLVINFPGAGIWTLFNGSTWGQIHSLTAVRVQVAKDGTLVLEFAGGGLWLRRTNGVWSQIHSMQTSATTTGDFDGDGVVDVVVTFPGSGVWMFRNGTNWVQLNPSDASKLVRSNLDGGPADDLVVDFGNGIGIWALRNLAVWAQVHSQSAKSISVADLDGNGTDDILMDFDAGAGVWVLANLSSWIHAFGSTTEGIAVGTLN